MSDNPFASSNLVTDPGWAPPTDHSGRPVTPGWVTAICIICLVLGVLGLLTVCMTVGGFFVNQTMQSSLASDDSEMAQAQVRMYQETNKQLIPNIILQIANLLIATSMIVGSVLTLTRKQAGPRLLRPVLLAAVVFNIVRGIYTVWVQVSMKDLMTSTMMAGSPDQEFAARIMETTYYATIAMGAVFAVVLIGYYIFAYKYFGRATAKNYFGTFD